MLFLLLVVVLGAEGRARMLANQRGEALLATESRFRALFEKAPLGMAMVESVSGRYLAVNHSLSRILGYSPEELLGRTFMSVTHPESLEDAQRDTQELDSGEIDDYSKEKKFIHKDGRTILARLQVVRLPGVPPESTRHLSIVEDITEARRQEEELLASEKRLRGIIDLSPDPITLTRMSDGALLMVNQAWCALTGIPEAEALGRTLEALAVWVHPHEREGVLDELCRQGGIGSRDATLRHRDGTERQVLFTAKVLNIGNEDLILVLAKDVTERHRIEAALRESEARFRMISENAGDVVWILGLDPVRFEYVSPSVLQLLGASPGEVVAEPVENTLTPESAERVSGFLRERIPAFREDELATATFTDEVDMVRRDGTVVPTEVTTRFRSDGGGRVTGVIGVTRDVSARKRAEASLEEAQSLARLGSWELDLANGALSWSSEVFRIFEIDASKFGASYPAFLETIHPEDRGLVDEAYRRSVEQGTDYTIRHRLLFPGGRIKHVLERGRSFYDAAGRPLRSLGTVQDVTDQVLAEQALQASESRLRVVTDQLPDSFVYQYVGAAGQVPRFSYISAGVERLCGLKPDDVLRDATPFLGQIDPASLPAYLEAESESRKNLTPFAMDLRQRRTDGEWRWFRVRSAPRRLADGSVAWEGISTDVTDQKMGQLILAESENRFRNMADSAPALIWMSGTDKACTWFNRGWLEWTGRTLDQETGDGWAEGVYPGDLPSCLETYLRSFDARKPFDMEYRLRHHSGAYRWIQDRGTPRFAEDGAFLGYVGACSDIHEQKAALDALRESGTRFRSVVENAVDAIFVNDMAGRILLCNREACRSTGYSQDELLRLRVGDLAPELPDAAHFEALRTLAIGQQLTFDGQIRRKDGTTFPAEVHIGLLSEEEPRRILAMARNLSEREHARESEHRARKAESLVLMAGGIAHDFNNLFQAVLSNMEIAELLAGKLESVREPIGQAKEVLRKAVSLSWKMLDFSGRGIVHLQPLDLGPWLEQFRAALEPGLPPSFRLELECEPVPGIDGDPSKLEQVLKAAVDNALEAAGPGGGCVRLRLFTDFGPGQPGPQSPGIWPIERPKGPASVCLEIADDGPGVPLERLGLVCDPFYTTKEPGRGLGLPAAVGILNAHGAGLHLLNGEGKGLILRLHFPPSGA
jgi:PAS domain S-box-containing protein